MRVKQRGKDGSEKSVLLPAQLSQKDERDREKPRERSMQIFLNTDERLGVSIRGETPDLPPPPSDQEEKRERH